MTDTAPHHWLEKYRAYALDLLHHLVQDLTDLHGHGAQAIDALAEQRRTLGRIAAEMTLGLERLELHHTPQWQAYATLAANLDAELATWHHLYEQGGVEAVRQHALADLRERTSELEHPGYPLPEPDDSHNNRAYWVVGTDAVRVEQPLHLARLAVAAVLPNRAHQDDRHDDRLWAAARSAWADLVPFADHIVGRGQRLLGSDLEDNDDGPRSTATRSGHTLADLANRRVVLAPLVDFSRVWLDPATQAAAALSDLAAAHTLQAALHELTGWLNALLVNLGYQPKPNGAYGGFGD